MHRKLFQVMWGVDKEAMLISYFLSTPNNDKEDEFSIGLRASLLSRYS